MTLKHFIERPVLASVISIVIVIGGLIGLVREGDLIDINIPAYQINVRVSDAEFEERRKAYVKPEPKVKSGWLERYGRLVSSANTGAVLK